MWREVLAPPAPAMMDLLAEGSGAMTRTSLAGYLGYTESGGFFRKGLLHLRQNGVTAESGDTVRLAKPLPGEKS
jgi:hypothetical protein